MNGNVIRIRGSKVHLRMDDGSKAVVDVPWLTPVDVGMRVAFTESGDGVPLIRWEPEQEVPARRRKRLGDTRQRAERR